MLNVEFHSSTRGFNPGGTCAQKASSSCQSRVALIQM